VVGVTDEHLPGNNEVLDALAVVSGEARGRLDTAFRAVAMKGDKAAAVLEHVVEALGAVIRHVQLAPIEFDAKPPVIEPLKRLMLSPPALRTAGIAAWRQLTKELPIRIVDVVRDPVVLPVMTPPREAAWSTILDFEDGLHCHWSLIGGQMVALISAERGQPVPRATTDGDVVLGVWLDRDALPGQGPQAAEGRPCPDAGLTSGLAAYLRAAGGPPGVDPAGRTGGGVRRSGTSR
jgi:hypothetical protein